MPGRNTLSAVLLPIGELVVVAVSVAMLIGVIVSGP